jgi:hypothetical protein
VYPTGGGLVRLPLFVTLTEYEATTVGVNVKVPLDAPEVRVKEAGLNEPVPGEQDGVTVSELARFVMETEKFPEAVLMFPFGTVGPERVITGVTNTVTVIRAYSVTV